MKYSLIEHIRVLEKCLARAGRGFTCTMVYNHFTTPTSKGGDIAEEEHKALIRSFLIAKGWQEYRACDTPFYHLALDFSAGSKQVPEGLEVSDEGCRTRAAYITTRNVRCYFLKWAIKELNRRLTDALEG